MKNIILVLVFLFKQTIIFSQIDHVPLSVGIGGGIDMISNTDISASPLTYNGFGLPLGINGFKMSDRWIHHMELQFIIPILTNNYSLSSKANTALLNWTKVNFNYQILRQTGANPNNYIGGSIKSSLFYREYDFLDGFGWEFQNSLNLSYARKINLNQTSFILPQISLPMFAYLNRKPSLTFDEDFLDDFNNNGISDLLKYGDWKFLFDNWFGIEFDLLYHVNLSNRFYFQGKLGFNYYTISFPEKIQNINIPIRCYLNYRF